MAPEPPSSGAVLDRLAAVDPAEMTPTERRDALRCLTRLSTVADALLARFVGAVDSHSDHVYDGARSAASWTATASGMDRRRCGGIANMARAVERYRPIGVGWRSGALATDKVRALLQAAEGVEQRMERDAEALVRAIVPITYQHARIVLNRWRESALAELGSSPDDPEPDDPKLNELSVTSGFDGTRNISGTFAGIVGTELAALIASEVDAGFRSGRYSADDGLTSRQRNADAMLNLCRRGASGHTEAGEPRRAVTILVDLNRLLGLQASSTAELLAWPCETSDGTRVPLAQVLDAMADATINTVLGHYGINGRFHPTGEITTARHANTSQRRHLRVRDQQCAWPGCEAPASWCEAHHEPPFERSHRTTTSRLVLLCRHHHTLRHRDGYEFDLRADGSLAVRRPDGTTIPTTDLGSLTPAEDVRAEDHGHELVEILTDGPEMACLELAERRERRLFRLLVRRRILAGGGLPPDQADEPRAWPESA